MDSLLKLFCHVDTFATQFLKRQREEALPTPKTTRNRKRSLCLSEVMTILITFHHSGYRTFKDFYCKHVLCYWRKEFPGLVSYNRFVEFIPSTNVLSCPNASQTLAVMFPRASCVLRLLPLASYVFVVR